MSLCESIEGLGLDGLNAAHFASALGYTNIKTNSFSARLSAARQFGLLTLTGERYALTTLARSILHPIDPNDVPKLRRQAFLKPPLYADLAQRLAGKRVPDPEILANMLYHHHHIIATAKRTAAEAFVESARFAGAIDSELLFHPEGPPSPPPSAAAPGPTARAKTQPTPVKGVRLDLSLWDVDAGKTIRLRAPQSISSASFERFLQAFRLLIKVED